MSKPKSFNEFFAKSKENSKKISNENAMEDMIDGNVNNVNIDDINTTVSWGKTGEEADQIEAKRLEDKSKMPWTEKYRPESLSDVISHQNIMNTLTSLIEKQSLPHLLFCGPPGTGKTSTALAVARSLNGSKAMKRMVLELNASDDRGIDTVRDKIKEFASARQLFEGGTKLIILDEADSMTRTAQFALRRVIEKYTSSTRFIIIANYVNKIIPALQSRCTSFRFSPLDRDDILVYLEQVASKEELKLDKDHLGLKAVVKLAHGDMRRCLNIMQSCKAAYGELTEETVYQCTGAPSPTSIAKCLEYLLNLPFQQCFQECHGIQIDKGLALIDIITSLHEFLLRLSLPVKALSFILPKLAEIELALSKGANEKSQLAALVGSFVIMRRIVFENITDQQFIQNITTTLQTQAQSIIA